MLDQIAHFNRLSPELRKELEERVRSFGKRVRYKFDISHENPDPEKYNGKILWPFQYTLDPTQFRITDPHEKRTDESKSKLIALVTGTDDKGVPNKFKKIRVFSREIGVKMFETEENIEDFNAVMYLELHPKLNGGKFQDKTKQPVFSRIDEKREAATKRQVRGAKAIALGVATQMSEKEVYDFAAAMMWNEHQDIDILRNTIEQMAEDTPEMFNDVVAGKNIEYQSTVKRAFDAQIIGFNPVDYKIIWSANQQLITSLGMEVTDKNEVQRFSEWLMTSGNKGDEVYKKIKSLLKV